MNTLPETTMQLPEIEPLTLMWWNTSLSPLAKPRASADDKKYAIQCIKSLRDTFHIDLMALGEVCTQDIMDIVAEINDPHLSYHDATDASGKSKFDTAILFNRRRLSLEKHGTILDSFGKATLKVGERLSFLSSDTEKCFHLFVSHWPSRLHCHETCSKRTEIGTSLRKELDAIRSSAADKQFIVLMGDYNDDPSSPSLANHLLATRDRDLVRDNDSFLYNPFWRALGESSPYIHGYTKPGICGTHYYSKGESSRWFTFDQIIYSSAFLQGGPFVLNEDKSMIIRVADLESRIKSSSEIFDHLPVLGVVEITGEQYDELPKSI